MGKFVKGQSGNPNGRPKVDTLFRDRARKAVDDHVIEAWIAEVEGMGDDWVKCSELLAAYGYGKPVQPTDNVHSSPDGSAPGLVVTFVKAGDK